MNELETINKGVFNLWRGDGWLLYTQFTKPKRLKFFHVNSRGEFRVRHKEKVLYLGTDLDKAIEVYNGI